MKTELKNSYWFVSIATFIQADGRKLRIVFGPQCNIKAYAQDYELKFNIQINFDTVISNLKSYFQYEIVMT